MNQADILSIQDILDYIMKMFMKSSLLMVKMHRYCAPTAKTFTSLPSFHDVLLRADAVCFDVDSTVIDEEGIDVLAAYKGAGEAVAELTKK
jgi:hypothetical protein